MNKQRYIVIQEWMLSLDLNVNELIAYALIFGFCQDGDSNFHGSIDYVAYWCQVGRRQAIRILNSLVAKGVVSKEEVPGHVSRYRVTQVPPVADMPPVTPMSPQGCHPALEGVTPMSPNNKIDIPEDNKDIPVVLPRTREKLTFGDYVQLTEDEHAKLVQRFGAEDTARMIELLDGYLANPKQRKRYESHYKVIPGWPHDRLEEEKLRQQRLKNAQEAGQRVTSNVRPDTGYGARAMEHARRLEELLKN